MARQSSGSGGEEGARWSAQGATEAEPQQLIAVEHVLMSMVGQSAGRTMGPPEDIMA
jgi:hypothetical protein